MEMDIYRAFAMVAILNQKSSDLGKIISCYVLTLFFIQTTSTCIVRLGDICNALHYSNQYFQ
jgi:hypothetical protein